MTFNKDVMAVSAMKGFTNSTDAADYLVGKGVPFRDAHGIIGQLVLKCIEKDCNCCSCNNVRHIEDYFKEALALDFVTA